jgi:hypothetical protein
MKDWRSPSHLRIDNDILRSKAFGQFLFTKEAAIWFYLCGWIIRGRMNSCGLANKLYEDFFVEQRKLVARWDQELIAEHLELSRNSKGYISRLIGKLEHKWKVIKQIKIPSYNSHKINIYELGYIDSEGRELLYLTIEFKRRTAKNNLIQYYEDGKHG